MNFEFIREWGQYGTGPGNFDYPAGIAVSPDGNVYVADNGNHRIQMFSPDGTWLMSWGGFGQGPGQLIRPEGIAIDASGRVYVTEPSNYRVQVFTAHGTFIRQWGSRGTGRGTFNFPTGVAIDQLGRVHVADYYNNRVQVFDTQGVYLTQWGGTPGPGALSGPNFIAVAEDGEVYVTDTSDQVHHFGTLPTATLRTSWAALKTRFR